MNDIMTIGGINCYEQDGTAYLSLESVARGLGFTKKADSGNEVVNWTRVRAYLKDFGVVHKCTTGDFIPENIFYRLAMKAKNEAAEKFQAFIADEVIPSIRKHGGYIAGQETMSNEELMAKALMVAQQTIADRDKRLAAAEVQIAIAQPKADYFDEMVDRNLLTNFRETAKQLGLKQRAFIDWLLAHKYVYRDKRGHLMPYADKGGDLFEIKESFNEKTQWAGTQTLVTPKGRETFRLLCQGI